jgi:hypothetical protein
MIAREVPDLLRGLSAYGRFHRGLADIGFVEGHNVAVDSRWADGRYDRQPALAADLVRHQVRVDINGRRMAQ